LFRHLARRPDLSPLGDVVMIRGRLSRHIRYCGIGLAVLAYGILLLVSVTLAGLWYSDSGSQFSTLKAQLKRHLAIVSAVERAGPVPFSGAAIARPANPQSSPTPAQVAASTQIESRLTIKPAQTISPEPASLATELAPVMSAEVTAPAPEASEPAAVETEPALVTSPEPAWVMSPAAGLDRNLPETPYRREPASGRRPNGSTDGTNSIPNSHEKRDPTVSFRRGALRLGTRADEQGRLGDGPGREPTHRSQMRQASAVDRRVASQPLLRPKKQAAVPMPSSGISATGKIDIVVHSTGQRRDDDGKDGKKVGLKASGNSRDTTRIRKLLKPDPLPYAQGSARRGTAGAAAPSTVATANTGEQTLHERIFKFRWGTALQSDSPHGGGSNQSDRGNNGDGIGGSRGPGASAANAGGTAGGGSAGNVGGTSAGGNTGASGGGNRAASAGGSANAGGASGGGSASASGTGAGGNAGAASGSGGNVGGTSAGGTTDAGGASGGGSASASGTGAGGNAGGSSSAGNAGGNGGGNAGGNGGGNAGGNGGGNAGGNSGAGNAGGNGGAGNQK
jgi:hypothetical protein